MDGCGDHCGGVGHCRLFVLDLGGEYLMVAWVIFVLVYSGMFILIGWLLALSVGISIWPFVGAAVGSLIAGWITWLHHSEKSATIDEDI